MGPRRVDALNTVCPPLVGVVSSGRAMVPSRRGPSSDRVVRWAGVCIFNLLVSADVPVGGAQLTSPAWWGFQCLQSSSKIVCCVAPEGNQDLP